MATATQADPTAIEKPKKSRDKFVLPTMSVTLTRNDRGRGFPKSALDVTVSHTVKASEHAHGGIDGVNALVDGKKGLFAIDTSDMRRLKAPSSVYIFDDTGEKPGCWRWDLMNPLDALKVTEYPVTLIYRRMAFNTGKLKDEVVFSAGNNSSSRRPAPEARSEATTKKKTRKLVK